MCLLKILEMPEPAWSGGSSGPGLARRLARLSRARRSQGFHVAVGGKMGSGGYRSASPLDVFGRPEDAAALCGHITEIFRDHGSRASRTKARLAFLVDAWGVAKLEAELKRRMGKALLMAGNDKRSSKTTDHLGIVKQKQAGLNSVGLVVPVGRITAEQLLEVARVADAYGTGDVRLTTGQAALPDAGTTWPQISDSSERMRGSTGKLSTQLTSLSAASPGRTRSRAPGPCRT